jgi:hypothetical protein
VLECLLQRCVGFSANSQFIVITGKTCDPIQYKGSKSKAVGGTLYDRRKMLKD